jgi:hypothetical protein
MAASSPVRQERALGIGAAPPSQKLSLIDMSGESVDGVNAGRTRIGSPEIATSSAPSRSGARACPPPRFAGGGAPTVRRHARSRHDDRAVDQRLIAFQSTHDGGLNPCSSYLPSAKRLAEIAPLAPRWAWAGLTLSTVGLFRQRSSASRFLAPASRHSLDQPGVVILLRCWSLAASRRSPRG